MHDEGTIHDKVTLHDKDHNRPSLAVGTSNCSVLTHVWIQTPSRLSIQANLALATQPII